MKCNDPNILTISNSKRKTEEIKSLVKYWDYTKFHRNISNFTKVMVNTFGFRPVAQLEGQNVIRCFSRVYAIVLDEITT